MEMTITLNATWHTTLQLVVSERHLWTRCYLPLDNQRYLGAEVLPYILARLLEMLRTPIASLVEVPKVIRPAEFRPGLAGLVAVLALSETHCSLHAGTQGDDLVLVWEDSEARPVLIGTLTPQDRLNWQTQLINVNPEPQS